MSDLDRCQKQVDLCHGNIVLWMEQADAFSAEQWKTADVGGVCQAIVLDWIYARKTSSDRLAFKNKFLAGQHDRDGNVKPNIPEDYLAKQKGLKIAYRETMARRNAIKKLTPDPGKTDTDAFEEVLDKTLELWSRLAWGGIECANSAPVGDMVELYNLVKDTKGSAYYGLSLREPKDPKPGDSRAGHSVGFGFRSEASRIEFIDANSGLYQFLNAQDMADFVFLWLYPAYGYDRFQTLELFIFDMMGGDAVSKDMDEIEALLPGLERGGTS